MSEERDAPIESVTPPDEIKSPARTTTASDQANGPKETALEADPKPQSKAKGKRPMSTPLSPPSPKRPATSSSKASSSRTSYNYINLSSNKVPDEPATTPSDPGSKTLQLTYHTGDIFAAPPRTLLIHACNTQGHWGAGIAKAFKTIYPKAYQVHHKFCAKEHSKTNSVPTGTAQLIAPIEPNGDEGHWIGCLFTSAKYGKAKDKPAQIIKNSGESIRQLLEMVKMADEERGQGNGVGLIRMCKINSGKFGVPWEKTEEVLRGIVVEEGWRGSVEVWEPVDL